MRGGRGRLDESIDAMPYISCDGHIRPQVEVERGRERGLGIEIERNREQIEKDQNIPVLLTVVVGLVVDTGTVVVLFDADLFFVAVLLFPRGKRLLLLRLLLRRLRLRLGDGGEGRVLTFLPSGLVGLLLGKFDLKLLMRLSDCLGLGLCLTLLVGGGKDAKGDGDTSFKIQIGGLGGAERRIF